MSVNELFKKAIKYMLDNGEFEKMLNYASSRNAKKLIKKDYEMFQYLEKEARGGVMEFPVIPLIMNINSVDTYRDILACMATLEVNGDGKNE